MPRSPTDSFEWVCKGLRSTWLACERLYRWLEQLCNLQNLGDGNPEEFVQFSCPMIEAGG